MNFAIKVPLLIKLHQVNVAKVAKLRKTYIDFKYRNNRMGSTNTLRRTSKVFRIFSKINFVKTKN